MEPVYNFKGSWVRYLPLIEFTYNNSNQESIEVILYEVLCGCKF